MKQPRQSSQAALDPSFRLEVSASAPEPVLPAECAFSVPLTESNAATAQEEERERISLKHASTPPIGEPGALSHPQTLFQFSAVGPRRYTQRLAKHYTRRPHITWSSPQQQPLLGQGRAAAPHQKDQTYTPKPRHTRTPATTQKQAYNNHIKQHMDTSALCSDFSGLRNVPFGTPTTTHPQLSPTASLTRLTVQA